MSLDRIRYFSALIVQLLGLDTLKYFITKADTRSLMSYSDNINSIENAFSTDPDLTFDLLLEFLLLKSNPTSVPALIRSCLQTELTSCVTEILFLSWCVTPFKSHPNYTCAIFLSCTTSMFSCVHRSVETTTLPERSCFMRPLLPLMSTGRKSLNQ